MVFTFSILGFFTPLTLEHEFLYPYIFYMRFYHTANEGPLRIQYKCLVPIYVFPEMKLDGLVIS
jgi:hypothetical protein